jgi:hypothetical protein
MPSSRRDADQEQPLLDSSENGNSVETSVTPSPTESRGYSNVRLGPSFLLPSSSDLMAGLGDSHPQDERTPLLPSRRSRVKIVDEAVPKPRLSRHQSTTGPLLIKRIRV